MSKIHSTGALSPEQHAAQNKRYAENHQYDYVIIGTGVAALTVGALLAKSGKKICMLEAHDIPGGYAHSFQMGDYFFCAQIHYIWGCSPGGVVYEFVKKLGLEDELTFEPLDPEGYDHMAMPDGKIIKIPFGYEQLAQNIDEAYPGQGDKVKKFTRILDKINKEIQSFPSNRKIKWWEYLIKWPFYLTLLKYRNKTVQDAFDECGLSKEAQLVLIANAGDMMSPPEELSIFAYRGLFGGYNSGAYYPTKHFKYHIDRLAQFIEEQEGCHIYYETPVSKINLENGKVSSIETENGKTFTATDYICNADPQYTAKNLIGWEHFPKSFQKPLDYSYSPAGVMIYLGLKDIDLRKCGLGSFNIWHCEQWDMNQMWKEQLNGNFEKPWIFISTATLHTDEGGVAPEGHHIMEVATLADYKSFKDLKNKDPKAYRKYKMEIADRMLDLVEKHYVPNLREHIAVKVVGTSVTNEEFVRAPMGTAYGSALTPEQIGLDRLKADSPWPNFFWCNASSGFAGYHGTTLTGTMLYMDLTGDRYYDNLPKLSTQEMINYAKKQWERHETINEEA